VKQSTIDYFRHRERAEREAARAASCPEARWAHEQMADAYARRIELERLKATGAVAPGKLIILSEALRERDGNEFGRRAGRVRTTPPASARRV
jgi:hypothetical protein